MDASTRGRIYTVNERYLHGSTAVTVLNKKCALTEEKGEPHGIRIVRLTLQAYKRTRTKLGDPLPRLNLYVRDKNT